MNYLLAAALILVCIPALVLTHQARVRVRDFQRQLRGAIEAAERLHAEMVAQAALERHIELLRAKLHALGRPCLSGDELYFGDTPITPDCAIVDEVKRQCGGVVTIFAGDRRVATTLLNPDHSRAIGTRLPAGLVLDRVLREGLSYHGEAEILGERYFAIYEPILAGGAVAGMLFAGLRKYDPELSYEAHEEGVASVAATVAALKAVLQAQADTLHRSLAARHEAEGRRRLEQDQAQAGFAQAA